MANVTLTNLTARIQLENGTDSEGKQKYVSTTLGDLSELNWNDETSPDKLLNVVEALEPILIKTIGRVQTVATSNIIA